MSTLKLNQRPNSYIERGTAYSNLVTRFLDSKDLKGKIDLFKKANQLGFKLATKRIASHILRTDLKELDGYHTNYRNVAFYLAWHCDIGRFYIRGVIRNGILGYFEKTTHHDLPLFDLLRTIGVMGSEYLAPKLGYPEDGGYYHIPKETLLKIANFYGVREKEVEWIAFKICFILASADSCHEYGEFDLDCTAPTSDDFIAGIAKENLPEKMRLFLADYFNTPKLAGKSKVLIG